MKKTEQQEENYANRFFLFLLVMIIIGALSSCTMQEEDKMHPLRANDLNRRQVILFNKDSSAFVGATKNNETMKYKLDTLSGFYLRVQ